MQYFDPLDRVVLKLSKDGNGFFTKYRKIEPHEAEENFLITPTDVFRRVLYRRIVLKNKEPFYVILLQNRAVIDTRRIKINEKETTDVFLSKGSISILVRSKTNLKIVRAVDIIID